MAAPFNDSCVLMRVKSSSAGGQLEHPSEVNNSTITAFLCAGPGAGLKTNAPSRNTDPTSKTRYSHESEFLIFHSFPCYYDRINIFHYLESPQSPMTDDVP